MIALTDILGPNARKILYAVLALAGVILGAIQIAYITSGAQPHWLEVTLAVFAFLGGSVHSLAGANVQPPVVGLGAPESSADVQPPADPAPTTPTA